MNKKKIIAALISVGIVVGFSLLYVNRVSGDREDAMSKESLVAVTSEKINRGSISKYQSFSGKTRGGEEENISLKIPSKVTEVRVKNGDYVKKGDILIRLDTTEVDKQVNSAKKAYDEVNKMISESNKSLEELKDKLKSTEEGIKKLEDDINTLNDEKKSYEDEGKNLLENLKNGEITKEEYEEKNKELLKKSTENVKILGEKGSELLKLKLTKETLGKTLENMPESSNNSQVDTLKKAYEAALKSRENYIIKSPINGYIENVTIKKGDSGISLMEPALKVINKETMDLVLQVDKNDLDKFEIGKDVHLEIHNKNGVKELDGEIESVSEEADKRTNQYSVVVSMSNSEDDIPKDAYGKVKIPVEEISDILVVNKNAILRDQDKSYLFKVEKDNSVKKVEVKTGIENDNFIEVTEGILDGDEIIIKGKEFIEDGQKVNILRGDN